MSRASSTTSASAASLPLGRLGLSPVSRSDGTTNRNCSGGLRKRCGTAGRVQRHVGAAWSALASAPEWAFDVDDGSAAKKEPLYLLLVGGVYTVDGKRRHEPEQPLALVDGRRVRARTVGRGPTIETWPSGSLTASRGHARTACPVSSGRRPWSRGGSSVATTRMRAASPSTSSIPATWKPSPKPPTRPRRDAANRKGQPSDHRTAEHRQDERRCSERRGQRGQPGRSRCTSACSRRSAGAVRRPASGSGRIGSRPSRSRGGALRRRRSRGSTRRRVPRPRVRSTTALGRVAELRVPEKAGGHPPCARAPSSP